MSRTPSPRAARAVFTVFTILAVAVAVSVLGCKDKDNGTTLVVNVLSDLHVPDQIDKIELAVVSDTHPDGGAAQVEPFTLMTNTSPLAQLAIRPKGAPDFSVELTARALHAGTVVVSQRARVAFIPDEAWQIDILLSGDCAGAGVVCSDPKPVCIKGGTCVAETMVATLRPYPGSSGDGGVDRPGVDAGRDGGSAAGTWRVASTPNVPAQATLNSVWPIAANDVWAVGAMGSHGVAYHYDGTAWTASALAATTVTPILYGVWASGTDDVWAVGTGGTIVHRTAASWLPSPSAVTNDLSGIFGLATNDITAVGSGAAIVHWSGTLWAPTTIGGMVGQTLNLVAVTGDGAGGLWAVGSGGAVLRDSGNAWQVQSHGKTTNPLYAVWASSATNVWAAGASVALHLSGTTWSVVGGAPDTTLGLWGSGENDVWAVGLAAGGGSAISHFDGSAWSAVAVPAGTGLQSVHGTAASDVWAVGNGGQILHFAP